MHVIFVNYGDFEGPSGIHIFHLANALVSLGVKCTAVVPGCAEGADQFGSPRFSTYSISTAHRLLPPEDRQVIHAWTPRETTRTMTEQLRRRLGGIPYIVHLEDDEESILNAYLGSGSQLRGLWRRFRLRFGRPKRPLPCPGRYRRFIERADAMTLIAEGLKGCVPHPLPHLIFHPACEEEVFKLPLDADQVLRRKLAISPEDIVITYPGNTHAANRQDVLGLYEAVWILRSRGRKVRFIRIGKDHVHFSNPFPALLADAYRYLPNVPSRKIPDYLAAADILVQPGAAGVYNDHRFPSKLPMFLASARAVVSGNGAWVDGLSDGRNAVIVREPTPATLADAIDELIKDPEKRRQIGQNGREYARARFSWLENARRLSDFYTSVFTHRRIQIRS
ncbi:MAG: hypothetical protein AUK55_16595 [Syntrophobacteraceae bacterium CG2_30_61_12]|nr:MAG: hypothetical protein AUK55_16595 [Syntrophobacteraceae bacterium CG2_30_61_12]